MSRNLPLTCNTDLSGWTFAQRWNTAPIGARLQQRGLSYAWHVATRVVLAEDSYIVREGIEQLLAGNEELELVASCSDLGSLLEAIDREAPDAVLTDIRMPPRQSDEGIQIAARLREEHPEIGVVVLSQYSDPTYALRLLDEGCEGRAYLLKERVHDRRELVAAIEAVAEGGSVIDPKVVEALIEAAKRARKVIEKQVDADAEELKRELEAAT